MTDAQHAKATSPETEPVEGDPMTFETDTTAPAAAASEVENVFVTKDLHVYYGDFLAVRNVDLEIAKNEITAFIGPSGCGKSTVLR